jgi:hypothetical protein
MKKHKAKGKPQVAIPPALIAKAAAAEKQVELSHNEARAAKAKFKQVRKLYKQARKVAKQARKEIKAFLNAAQKAASKQPKKAASKPRRQPRANPTPAAAAPAAVCPQPTIENSAQL